MTEESQNSEQVETVEPDVAKTDVEATETVTPSNEDFAELQRQMVELQTENDKQKKAIILSERNHLFSDLEQLNPKLAKLNEKSSVEMLRVVIQTARELEGGFPSLNNEASKPKEASAGDHDTADYDFEKKAWVYT